MTDFTFFYGAASGSSRKALRQLEEPNIMINYATHNNSVWEGIENLFIDSGGYSFMKGKGEYSTSDKEYLQYVENNKPDFFALRDYPCETEVLEEHDTTVRKHQEKTTERHRNLLELLEIFDIDAQPVSVIQGWKLEDYLRHINQMKQKGVLTDYVAIGSVCRRNKDEEIREIVNAVSSRIGDRKLHAFGVKSNLLRFEDMRKNLDSADSNAFDMSSRYADYKVNPGTRGFQDLALHYLQFKKKINNQLFEEKEETPDIPKNQSRLDI